MAGDSSAIPPVPSRAERKVCHAARDKYLECLDKHDIEGPAAAGTPCADLRKAMYADCPEVWAAYFEKLRVMKRQTDRLYKDRT